MDTQNLNFREFVENHVDDWEVVSLYHQHPDLSVREIAKQTHRSVGEVYRTLQRGGGYTNRLAPQHDVVRQYADAGMTPNNIADLTGYTARNVRHILGKSDTVNA